MSEEDGPGGSPTPSRRTLLAVAAGAGGLGAVAVYSRSSGIVLRDRGDGFGGWSYGAGGYGE